VTFRDIDIYYSDRDSDLDTENEGEVEVMREGLRVLGQERGHGKYRRWRKGLLTIHRDACLTRKHTILKSDLPPVKMS
jgi:hypothetical protein